MPILQRTPDGIMLLALDTATTTASLALYDLDANSLLAEWTWQARRRHTQDTLVALHTLLEQQALTPTGLTACAVTTGPGSFTGVRIGVSLAKGLALGASGEGRDLAVLGVPTLCVTARPWLPLLPPNGKLCAFIQAGRGRYNWLWFAAGETLRIPTREDHLAGDADAFTAAIETARAEAAPIWLAGESDDTLAQSLSRIDGALLLDETAALRRAGHLAHFAAQHLARGPEKDNDKTRNNRTHDFASLEPIYLAPA